MWDLVYAIGRVALVVLFIMSGFGKLTDPAGLTNMLAQKAFPMPMLLTYLAGIVEIGAGILVAIGWQARLAAFALIAFTIVATLIAHQYWTMTGAARYQNYLHFWKNVAMIGGLLMVAANGAGRFALGRR